MYSGFLKVNEVEVFNRQRVESYVRALMPGVDVRKSTTGLRELLADPEYVSPSVDGAPWVITENPASADFLGFWPNSIEGAGDSTREVSTTELTGPGAAHAAPRHTSKEMRIKFTGFALTEEAMAVGFAWIRHLLTEPDCEAVFGSGCTGRQFTMLQALPTVSRLTPTELLRVFHNVEVIDGPDLIKPLPSKRGWISTFEMVISAGIPWAFSPIKRISALAMNSAVNFTDPAGEDCSITADPYTSFINDPYFTAIVKPPRAPAMKPPNLLAVTSWRRRSAPIPLTISRQWGSTVPIVEISTGAETASQLRIRFYEQAAGLSGCDFDGEFLVSYIPANSTLTLDGINQESYVTLPDGARVPASHLLFGSAGRPYMWPEMSCHSQYTMVADIMPGQTDITVTLDAAVRE